jgi:hypothetical protein
MATSSHCSDTTASPGASDDEEGEVCLQSSSLQEAAMLETLLAEGREAFSAAAAGQPPAPTRTIVFIGGVREQAGEADPTSTASEAQDANASVLRPPSVRPGGKDPSDPDGEDPDGGGGGGPPGGSKGSAEDVLPKDRAMHRLRVALLEQMVDHIPLMKTIGGVHSIPFLQVKLKIPRV